MKFFSSLFSVFAREKFSSYLSSRPRHHLLSASRRQRRANQAAIAPPPPPLVLGARRVGGRMGLILAATKVSECEGVSVCVCVWVRVCE